ncbi:hypothetical protein ACGFJ7_12760 [Actinoplanes sp. NPDC048988]|uniref:hypothetical protein n=1 Tax=Actinoplanes sp. NPDC048988 TaxID=3363901 RepID=UPI0037217EA3
MSPLERRYARLLRLYPAGYRHSRGPELLATLLESAEEGRRRPSAREDAALILGALRAHAGHHRGGWLTAFRAAALMLLVYDVADRAVVVTSDLTRGGPALWSPTEFRLTLAALALGALAIVAALANRFAAAIVTAAAAFGVTLSLAYTMGSPVFSGFWCFPLAVVLLAPLVRRRPAPATALVRYAPVLPLVLILTSFFPSVSGILNFAALSALFLGSLVWLAVDERLAMAAGLFLLNTVLVRAALFTAEGLPAFPLVAADLAVTALPPVALLLAAGVVVPRWYGPGSSTRGGT